MATESSSPFAIFFSSRGSPTSASSPSKPRTFFEFLGLGPKLTEEEIPSFRAEFDDSTGTPLHIYNYHDEAKLFILHHQIVKEVNKIYETYQLPQIPADFLGMYHIKVFGKAPPPKNWIARLFSFGGGGSGTTGKVSPNNDTPPSEYYLSVRKSVELSSVPTRELQPYYRIPTLLFNCCSKIRYEASTIGIFRISGNTKRINKLTSIFLSPPDYGLQYKIEPEFNTFDVADTLKKYFKTLEEPIFTTELHNYFLQVTELPESARIRCIQLLMMLLPKENSIVLGFLLELLHDVGMYEKDNQMPVSNLAIVFGPNLMRAATVNQTLLDHNKSTKFLVTMIQNYSAFQLDQYSVAGVIIPPDMDRRTSKGMRLSIAVPIGLPKKSAMKSRESVNNVSTSVSQELSETPDPRESQVRASSGGSHKKVNFGGSMIVGVGAPPEVSDLRAEQDVQSKPKSILERFHIS